MHYVMLALVPQHIKEVGAFLDGMLAPFDENKEVPLQLVPADPWLDHHLRSEGALTVARDDPRYLEEYARVVNARAVEAGCTLESDPTEFMAFQDGKLLQWTTHNPDGKWDWWVVGGRWTGVFNKDASPDDVATNSLPVPDIIARGWIPHSLLTPSGQWSEHKFELSISTAGVFEGEREPEDEWKTRCSAILEGHRDCIGVIVDYHS